MLDRNYYLASERFFTYQKSVVDEFRRLPTRAPAHMGGGYKEDPLELKAQLDGYFIAPEWSRTSSEERRALTPKAIVAPHIDFHRGGPAYAWAYKPLVESEGADLYILLGTSHCGGGTAFVLTPKDFATPLASSRPTRSLSQGCKKMRRGSLCRRVSPSRRGIPWNSRCCSEVRRPAARRAHGTTRETI